jgi:hypothetical protein
MRRSIAGSSGPLPWMKAKSDTASTFEVAGVREARDAPEDVGPAQLVATSSRRPADHLLGSGARVRRGLI